MLTEVSCLASAIYYESDVRTGFKEKFFLYRMRFALVSGLAVAELCMKVFLGVFQANSLIYKNANGNRQIPQHWAEAKWIMYAMGVALSGMVIPSYASFKMMKLFSSKVLGELREYGFSDQLTTDGVYDELIQIARYLRLRMESKDKKPLSITQLQGVLSGAYLLRYETPRIKAGLSDFLYKKLFQPIGVEAGEFEEDWDLISRLIGEVIEKGADNIDFDKECFQKLATIKHIEKKAIWKHMLSLCPTILHSHVKEVDADYRAFSQKVDVLLNSTGEERQVQSVELVELVSNLFLVRQVCSVFVDIFCVRLSKQMDFSIEQEKELRQAINQLTGRFVRILLESNADATEEEAEIRDVMAVLKDLARGDIYSFLERWQDIDTSRVEDLIDSEESSEEEDPWGFLAEDGLLQS